MESERREIVTKWIFGYLRNQKELFNNSALEVYSKLLFFVVAGDGAISPAEREWIIGHRAASGKHVFELKIPSCKNTSVMK